ncbi:MAG: gamma-glutamyl kinase [Rubellimicrobium sp.]|nr:gamma-glutamyl kinase [Rubellimicrobium sp.]
MLVFWKERLVMLAVPKTGTTALEEALSPRADLVFRNPPVVKHTPLYRYRRFLAPYLAATGAGDLETVALVRAPVDWLGSWWRYRSRADVAGQDNSTAGISFDDFVREYCKRDPAPFAQVGSQARFLHDAGGAPVTHLFRYEDQPRFLAFLASRLGPLPDMPRVNVSPARLIALSPGVERRLRDKRADEFALWDGAGATDPPV